MSEHILSLSYGKDSIACIEAVKQLGYPLDGIATVDVWFDNEIRAELPPMLAFKEYTDNVIKKRYGIEVQHLVATDQNGNKQTYKDMFYRVLTKGKNVGKIYGFPCIKGAWCNSQLKMHALSQLKKGRVDYIGIAYDEPRRIERHQGKKNVIMPLVELKWTEAMCRDWCEQNSLLSPVYQQSARDGCWFCHNQQLNQLRHLRQDYPYLWKELLLLDQDSPVTFRPNTITVAKIDKRFELEDKGLVPVDRTFKWDMVDYYDRYEQLTFY